ncbi:MAG: SDR family oxidoreductase [Candidatus Odinarchaeia archaeon]
MDLGLKDKVAVVAASSRGIGKAVALGLAHEGVKLTICARGEEQLFKTAEEIRQKTGAQVLAIPTDVTKEEQVKNLIKETIKEYETVHILVNNAGGPPTGYFLEIPQKTWEEAVRLNLMSTIYMCREVIPYMIKQKWGRIINLTSFSVKQPIDGLILSNTVRAGVIGLAKTLSNEYGKYNILVNNVCPGYTFTERVKKLAETKANAQGTTPDKIIENWTKNIPLGRLGKPEEIANLVVFLASEKASYITGTSIQVDGGLIKGIY